MTGPPNRERRPWQESGVSGITYKEARKLRLNNSHKAPQVATVIRFPERRDGFWLRGEFVPVSARLRRYLNGMERRL